MEQATILLSSVDEVCPGQRLSDISSQLTQVVMQEIVNRT